ncbi:hypothetical protein Q3G72_022503 [Acer saccharum]|nr:hypothetical protein Q3G72_022503 [Acer saccharum]
MADDHPELKPAVVDIGANEIAYIFRVLPFGNQIKRSNLKCVIRFDGTVCIQGVPITTDSAAAMQYSSDGHQMIFQQLSSPGLITVSFTLPGPVDPHIAKLAFRSDGILEPISSHNNRWSLRRTTALVTGGTRGIGRAIVEELVGFGAKVHTCSRNETELNECLENWVGSGFEVTGSICDVSIRAQREQLIGTLSSLFDNKLDILVNNVGTNIWKPMDVSDLHPLCLVLSHLFRDQPKELLNLACEWAKDNIRCNAIAPWYIKTSMVEQVLSNKEYLEEVYS